MNTPAMSLALALCVGGPLSLALGGGEDRTTCDAKVRVENCENVVVCRDGGGAKASVTRQSCDEECEVEIEIAEPAEPAEPAEFEWEHLFEGDLERFELDMEAFEDELESELEDWEVEFERMMDELETELAEEPHGLSRLMTVGESFQGLGLTSTASPVVLGSLRPQDAVAEEMRAIEALLAQEKEAVESEVARAQQTAEEAVRRAQELSAKEHLRQKELGQVAAVAKEHAHAAHAQAEVERVAADAKTLAARVRAESKRAGAAEAPEAFGYAYAYGADDKEKEEILAKVKKLLAEHGDGAQVIWVESGDEGHDVLFVTPEGAKKSKAKAKGFSFGGKAPESHVFYAPGADGDGKVRVKVKSYASPFWTSHGLDEEHGAHSLRSGEEILELHRDGHAPQVLHLRSHSGDDDSVPRVKAPKAPVAPAPPKAPDAPKMLRFREKESPSSRAPRAAHDDDLEELKELLHEMRDELRDLRESVRDLRSELRSERREHGAR